jgi:crotonobetainyl-CoA:carnitine CoA-transferase CaiB-like acyl-CoA transferase
MAEVVATTVGEFVAEASAGSTRTLPNGCELAPFSPHGVYRTADARWLALAVASDAEWRLVVDALEEPEGLTAERWSSAPARFADRAALDAALGEIVAGLGAGRRHAPPGARVLLADRPSRPGPA